MKEFKEGSFIKTKNWIDEIPPDTVCQVLNLVDNSLYVRYVHHSGYWIKTFIGERDRDKIVKTNKKPNAEEFSKVKE